LQEGVAGATDAGSAHDEDTIVMTTDDDVSDDDIEPAIAAARRELSEPGDFSDWGESAAAAGSDSTALDHGDVRAGASSAGAAHSWTSASTSKTPSFGASASVSANGSMPDAAADGTDREHPSDSVGFAAEGDEPGVQSTTESRAVGATGGAPIVDWPSEGSRKIVALRLVSHPAARFQGRAVRQALAAEGFVLGKFDIFHKAGPDDRAILSAASLTKPGTFAMNTIDGQRFGGISLFAVLPGPLPPQETFDELLHTARALNDRLQGALQDERGEPLTPMRSASIRQSLSEGNGSTGPAPSPEPQPETRQ
jgi:cell division protein ZipA